MTVYNPAGKKRNEKYPTPLVYLSGGYTVPIEKEKSWLKRVGCTHRCYSFGYVRPGAIYHDERVQGTFEIDLKAGIGIMMDSSAFSFHVIERKGRAKGLLEPDIDKLRQVVIKDYTKFIKEQKGKLDFYVNFDYRVNSPIIYKMQQHFEKQGIQPMPMFHGDSGFEWLKRYLDEGYDYIGIGSDKTFRTTWEKKKRYINEVFELASKYKNIRLHGFGMTGHALMLGWPWYSVDSATWAKIAAYGQILVVSPIDGRIKYLHVSDRFSDMPVRYERMEKSVKKVIRNLVEDRGFDFDLVRTEPYERALFNAYMFAHIHQFVPKESRGSYSKWESIL